MLHADGHQVWFEYRLSYLVADNPNRFMCVKRDITERRERQRLEIERASEEAARQLSLIRCFDLSFDLVAHFEVTEGRVRRLYSSRSHKTVLGHDPASCNGDMLTLTHLYTADFLNNGLPELVTLFENGESAVPPPALLLPAAPQHLTLDT